MQNAASGGLPVVGLGNVCCGSLFWSAHKRLHATVVVKAMFSFSHDDAMRPLAGSPSPLTEEDMAPYLGQADAFLTAGHAYAPPAEQRTVSAARFAVFRNWAVIDRSLLVYGPGAGPSHKPLFSQAALFSDAEGDRAVCVDPHRPLTQAGFGAWPMNHKSRQQTLRGKPEPRRQHDVLELPPMFPWSFYQRADPSQRCDYFHGNEWVVLDGMHPEQRRLQSHLPGAQAHTRIYAQGGVDAVGNWMPVQMYADCLMVDADRLQCSLVFRGSFPLACREAAEQLVAVVGVETWGHPIDWPKPSELKPTLAVSSGPTAPTQRTLGRFPAGVDDLPTLPRATRPVELQRAIEAIDQSPPSLRLALRSGAVTVERVAAALEPTASDAGTREELVPVPMEGAPWSERLPGSRRKNTEVDSGGSVPILPESSLSALQAKLEQSMIESACYEDLRWTLGDE